MSEQQDPPAAQPAPSEPPSRPAPPAPTYGPPPPGTPFSVPPAYPAPQHPAAQHPAPQYPAPPRAFAPPPRQGLPTGAIVGIVAGGVALLLVLLLALGFGLLGLVGPALAQPDREPPAGPGPAPAEAAAAVEGYLDALAAGDADAALEYLWVDRDDTLLPPDEAFAASAALAPITGIEVGEPEGDDFEAVVPASFELGGERVERSFRVWESASGWRVSDGLVAVSFAGFEGLGPTLNGAPVTGYTEVFPGVYEFALENEYLEVEPSARALRLATEEDSFDFYGASAVLSGLGEQTFRSLVRDSLEQCLAMTSLTTPCGLDVVTGSGRDRPVDGTVRRELTDAGVRALETLGAEQDYDPPSAVISADDIPVRVTVQLQSGETAEATTGYLRYPRVDFAAAQPRVEWID